MVEELRGEATKNLQGRPFLDGIGKMQVDHRIRCAIEPAPAFLLSMHQTDRSWPACTSVRVKNFPLPPFDFHPPLSALALFSTTKEFTSLLFPSHLRSVHEFFELLITTQAHSPTFHLQSILATTPTHNPPQILEKSSRYVPLIKLGLVYKLTD